MLARRSALDQFQLSKAASCERQAGAFDYARLSNTWVNGSPEFFPREPKAAGESRHLLGVAGGNGAERLFPENKWNLLEAAETVPKRS